ncbi:putative immunity protein [Sphingomonas sp. HMP6]|uniref:putative immunity protein n=1 Tax=Sphingomonas sp. HMP6 TaxID=1517551 RepID=UPI0015968C3A|nr:exonuclease SbcC [Sphingomonas sp. HMP6]BCA57493.1 hypothetical protein HMP06_0262 [Sphingomonas sp. HMP6]
MQSGEYIDLSIFELRAVTSYAEACASPALTIFEEELPADERPRLAIEVARAFADGGKRTKAIRDAAWAAMRAYRDARDGGNPAAGEAARAAMIAASAAFLHPLANAAQVGHILGSAAHTARALELSTHADPTAWADHMATSRNLATPVVVSVLKRYPPAPSGGGRVGELIRELDAALR